MYGLIGSMRAVPGQRNELIAILLEGVSEMPGCLSYVVAEDPTDADTIWITEVWDRAESHQASLSLPSVRQAIARGRPLIAGFGVRHETRPIGGHGLTVAATGSDGLPSVAPQKRERMWTPRARRVSAARRHSRLRWCAALLVAGGGAQLPAQAPPILDSVRVAACGTNCDVVTGIVHDSLLREPLAGALVTAFPSGLTTTTDSLGRFQFVSDAPIMRVVAFHDALDRIGLGGLEARRPERDTRWHSVRLSTPSLLTLWPRLCGERRPAAARATILTGTARLADDRTRIAGARVIAQWPRPASAIGGEDPRTLETLTDSLGNFLLCGIEEYVEPALVALAAEVQSGVIRLPSEARPVRRVDLVLGRVDDSARGVLRGRVVNEQQVPVPNVRVGVDGVEGEALTSAQGEFVLLDVPHGSRMLWTRALGFSPTMQAVEVFADARPAFTIMLQRAIELEGVTVTARTDLRATRVDFEWRKRAGWARFLDSTAIMRGPFLRSALAELPGLRVMAGESAESFVLTGRGGCAAHLYLDGTPVESIAVSQLPRDQLAAVEMYSSVAFAPAQLVRIKADNCAVVAFWTKWALRP